MNTFHFHVSHFKSGSICRAELMSTVTFLVSVLRKYSRQGEHHHVQILTFIWKLKINEQSCPVCQIAMSQEKPGKQTWNNFSLTHTESVHFAVKARQWCFSYKWSTNRPSLLRMVEGPPEWVWFAVDEGRKRDKSLKGVSFCFKWSFFLE